MAYKVPNFFFLHGKLYKKLNYIASEDMLIVWSYDKECKMTFNVFEVRRHNQKAYRINQVAELIQRKPDEIKDLINRGLADRPIGQSYHITSRKPSIEFWSEDDIIALRDRFYDLTKKTKEGIPYTKFKLVNKSELLAKLRGEEAVYVRNEEGEFVRIWKAV